MSGVVIRFKNIPALNPSSLCVLKMIAELKITHATNDNSLSKMNFRSLSFFMFDEKKYSRNLQLYLILYIVYSVYLQLLIDVQFNNHKTSPSITHGHDQDV